MTHVFTFDASACSGCKACQEACKDKNGLPVGILWRQVIEVSGGEWQKASSVGKPGVWENSIFAYNLSLACNHCVHPKCAGVCPTDAFTVRADGIVLIDTSKCMGCGYCAWACPYEAPQYNPQQGIMTKCNFCYDDLDAGLPPACVAACPLRVLNYTTVEELSTSEGYLDLWQLPALEHPFPLPDYSRTEPNLSIRPHAGMSSMLEKTVANREEIQPSQAAERILGFIPMNELPLVAFTLLAQMAAGIAVCSLAFSPIPLPVLLSIGILLGVGGLISFLHLGRKRNAWRSIVHLKKSWLSREVLSACLFAATWGLTVVLDWLKIDSLVPWLMAILGLGFIYSMSWIYRLRAVPAWNTWRTPVAFYLSAAVLGALGVNLMQPEPVWVMVAGLVLAAEMSLMLTNRTPMRDTACRLRFALLGMGMVVIIFMILTPQEIRVGLAIPLFLVALAAEVIGRGKFYNEHRHRF